MANARKAAATALMRIEKNGAYSNLTLAKIFAENDFSPADRAFASACVYGTLDRKITIDYILGAFLKKGISALKPYTAAVLRSAVYQLLYMEKVPESAAVNEAVKLIKGSKEQYNAALVNAVLRNIIRNGAKLPDGNDASALSVRYSCPEWIVNSFISDYGIETAQALLEETLKSPPVILRVNTLRTTPDQLCDKLAAEGISAETAAGIPAVKVNGGIDIASSRCYKNGLFYAQDIACQRSVERLSPSKGSRILDLCAAPGGKSFTAALLMENCGEVLAFDIYEKRVKLIENGAKRLGISCICAKQGNAAEYTEALGVFDAVICDVPCSGLGVLRRKPELKYKTEKQLDLPSLEKTQAEILANAARYVKAGGKILYSTCTLRKAENEGQIKSFLDKHGTFAVQYEYAYLPHIDNTDGFYCALLVKER